MTTSQEFQETIHRFEEVFGSRSGALAWQLCILAISGQPCDVCTYSGKRYLDVKIGDTFIVAYMYGAGLNKLAEMLKEIKLKKPEGDTATVSIEDIWVIHPMPSGGFSEEELNKVDTSQGEEKWGPSGETLREMIQNVYHCKDEAEVEYFLRRYLAF